MNALPPYLGKLRRQFATLRVTTRTLGLGRLPLAWKYAAGIPFGAKSEEKHLAATVEWLCLAQDVTRSGGVSAVYSLSLGWDVPYPETSGYIVATLLACSDYFGDASLSRRACRIGDWEIEMQAPNGGIYSRPGLAQTRVFNTGQVILGWCVLFEKTGDERYLTAARRAGDYLLRIQEKDGTWRKDTYCGPRTYHARTDWGLMRLARFCGEERYLEAAKRNLDWVLCQRQDNGWFRNCGFHDENPITHVIDYTFIGVLECALLEPNAFATGPVPMLMSGADAICDAVDRYKVGGIPGMIPSSYDAEWQSRDEHSCLTGNAQLAYTLLRLYQLTDKARYLQTADVLINALKMTQAIDCDVQAVRGGLPGSYPMHTGYLANSFPNWGAKFFADALLASLQRGKGFATTA